MNIKIFKKFIRKDPNFLPNKCFSQNGEDLILNRLLENKSNGFFVDVGAHHPVRFSNTYLFYLNGWNGINIDAMPNSMMIFDRTRPRDINIEVGISSQEEKLTYYKFNEPALNTFDSFEAESKNKGPYKIIDSVNLYTTTLEKVLKKNLPSGQEIDFFNIDVEGKDFDVLISNDWNIFRPKFILIEIIRNYHWEVIESSIFKYLSNIGYKFISCAYNTAIFQSE